MTHVKNDEAMPQKLSARWTINSVLYPLALGRGKCFAGFCWVDRDAHSWPKNKLYATASDTFSMPTSYIIPLVSGCGKREAHNNWSMVTCKGSTRYWNYLEVYWPCAGGLSAVNAIGTQLRDSINSGLTNCA